MAPRFVEPLSHGCRPPRRHVSVCCRGSLLQRTRPIGSALIQAPLRSNAHSRGTIRQCDVLDQSGAVCGLVTKTRSIQEAIIRLLAAPPTTAGRRRRADRSARRRPAASSDGMPPLPSPRASALANLGFGLTGCRRAPAARSGPRSTSAPPAPPDPTATPSRSRARAACR